MVHADIADEDRILRQRLVDFERGTLRIDRGGVVGKSGGDELVPLFPVAIDLRQPLFAGIGFFREVATAIEFGMHLPQEGVHIGHQPERDRIITADLFGIDVDMDQPRRRDGEGIARYPRARRAVVEPHPHRQQHVGLTRRVVGLVVAGARDETQRQRMVAIDRAKSACRGRDRNLQPLGEPQEFLRRAAIAHALPDNDRRPLGAEQHVDGFHHAIRIGAAAARYVGVPFDRVRRLLGRRLHEHVKGHVEHHGSGTARCHGLPGLPHRQRHHLAARRLKHLLAHRAHGGGKIGLVMPVHFLEGAAVELAGRHVAGHRHERHGIEEGVGERDRQVRRAGPAGRKGRRRPPRDAVVHVGHEAGDALVMHRDGLDVGFTLEQRVDELDIAVPAQAEDVRHFLPDQIVDDDLGAVQHIGRHRIRLLTRSPSLMRHPGLASAAKLGLIMLYVN